MARQLVQGVDGQPKVGGGALRVEPSIIDGRRWLQMLLEFRRKQIRQRVKSGIIEDVTSAAARSDGRISLSPRAVRHVRHVRYIASFKGNFGRLLIGM